MRQSIFQDREGFQVREGRFTVPTNTSILDPQSKRAVTICNLFVNHQYSISDIVRVLDEDRGNVVLALLKKGIIRERRMQETTRPEGSEPRKTIIRPKVTLRSI